jgi:hypothetical protein
MPRESAAHLKLWKSGNPSQPVESQTYKSSPISIISSNITGGSYTSDANEPDYTETGDSAGGTRPSSATKSLRDLLKAKELDPEVGISRTPRTHRASRRPRFRPDCPRVVVRTKEQTHHRFSLTAACGPSSHTGRLPPQPRSTERLVMASTSSRDHGLRHHRPRPCQTQTTPL